MFADALLSAARPTGLAGPSAMRSRTRASNGSCGIVDGEDSYRGPGDFRQANESRAPPSKMTCPTLLPWMKQPRNVVTQRINPSNVGAFVLVAVQATPSEIVQHRFAAVLLRDDMVDLKRQWVGGAEAQFQNPSRGVF